MVAGTVDAGHAYDTKIQEINRLMDKLNKGEDFPLSEVDKRSHHRKAP